MTRLWTALIVAVSWARVAAAATPSAPVPGTSTVIGVQERLVVKPGSNGHPTVLDRQPVTGGPDVAPPADFSKEQLTAPSVKKPSSAAVDTVVVTLWFDKGVSTLKVENGFDHPVSYQATLIARRGGKTLTRMTSICPVRAKAVSYEAWPDKIDGIAIDSFRATAPGDLACNGDSALSLPPQPIAPVAPVAVNACLAGNILGNLPPGAPRVQVRVMVSPKDGAVQSRSAVWGVGNSAGAPMPEVLLEYPVQDGVAAPEPSNLNVFEAISMKPPPPTPTASIMILADGVERTRRPWQYYAQAMAAIANGGQTPQLLLGLVPFNVLDRTGRDEPMAQLLADIGAGRVKTLEVRVIGALGRTMDSHLFALGASPAHDPAILTPLLREAEAEAAAPDHCPHPAAPPAP